MAKSNAQRQREWRERQKQKHQCAYGGCPNPVKPPATLCDEHLQQAREKRAGQVRQLRAEVEILRIENAELRGRIAELEARYTELLGRAVLQAEYDELAEDFEHLASYVRAAVARGELEAPEAWSGPCG